MQVEVFPAVLIGIVQNTTSVLEVDVKVNAKVKEIAKKNLFLYLVKQFFT